MVYSEGARETCSEGGKCAQAKLLLGIRVTQRSTNALGNTELYKDWRRFFGLRGKQQNVYP